MRRLLIALVVVVVGAAIVFLVWPFRASAPPTPTATVVRGTIESVVDLAGTVASPDVRSLAFGATGTVATVEVKEGDVVAAEQVLATLDPELLDAQLAAADAQLAAARKRLSADEAGPTRVQKAAARGVVIQAQAGLSAARRALKTTTASQDASVATARVALEAAEATLAGHTAAGAVEEVLAADRSAIAAATIALGTARNQRTAARNQAATAVASAEAALNVANRQYAAQIAGTPAAVLVADRAAVASAEAQVVGARSARDAATIRSPIAGTVAQVGIAVGDRIAAGTSAGRIVVADLTALQVEATASEIDVVDLAVGRAVAITIDALEDVELVGRICEMGIVGNQVQGVTEYPVTICLTAAESRLRVGMSANGSVTLDRREGVLVVPSAAVRTTGGRHLVTVVGANGQELEVEVTVGLTSGTRTEIVGGLSEGQTVALPAVSAGS